MKKIVFINVLILLSTAIFAQDRFYTKTGKISFFSKAPLENIEALNRSVTCVLDTKNGNLQFAVQVKGFEFPKALMQEHFNEDYLESDRYPRSEFRGQVVNNSEIDYSKDGTYPAKVKGNLSIHGSTKPVEMEGKLTVKGGKIVAFADFNILLSDYNIKNDKLNNISNRIRVSVDCILEPLKS